MTKYAILDIETTGGNATSGRITEISIFIHDGTKVLDEFTSLVNPEVDIPPFIASLTGISNQMVSTAPKFYEVAKRIVEVTEGCILVAHNSEFDYGFIKAEFARLGYRYRRNSLCSVELSRRLLPGMNSYSLGRLCEQIGIDISDRHRARGDAKATVSLFELLLKQESSSQVIEEMMEYDVYSPRYHAHIPKEVIDSLPEITGVYYFYDADGEVIYVGKSKNVRRRIMQHLSNHSTERSIRLAKSIAAIDYEHTGSELVALLLESAEIKRLKPQYNRAQKKTKTFFGIYRFYDDFGYINFKIGPVERDAQPVSTAFTRQEATKIMERIVDKFNLCQKLSGLYKSEGSCFRFQINSCNGACIQEEPPELYNIRAEQAISFFSYGVPNLFLIDKGRFEDEKAVIHIENGSYKGFGYYDTTSGVMSPEQLRAVIKPYDDNKDVNKIIRGFLRKKNGIERRIKY